jgi:DNA-binding winged helix-turn-helix (wHTH) protein
MRFSAGRQAGPAACWRPAVRLEFDDVTLDLDTRQLLRAGKERPLVPKALDLLALLIHNRPRAVSKAEIHERLWLRTRSPSS